MVFYSAIWRDTHSKCKRYFEKSGVALSELGWQKCGPYYPAAYFIDRRTNGWCIKCACYICACLYSVYGDEKQKNVHVICCNWYDVWIKCQLEDEHVLGVGCSQLLIHDYFFDVVCILLSSGNFWWKQWQQNGRSCEGFVWYNGLDCAAWYPGGVE